MAPNPCIAALAILTALGGCRGYDVTFNDQLLYEAPDLLNELETADPALGDCLRQTIADEKISAPEQLTRLSCTHSGITSLEGIGRFTALARLRLSNNDIVDVAPLARLGALEDVLLDGNAVEDADVLLTLPGLARLDLRGNDGLACPAPGEAPARLELALPEHCLQRGSGR